MSPGFVLPVIKRFKSQGQLLRDYGESKEYKDEHILAYLRVEFHLPERAFNLIFHDEQKNLHFGVNDFQTALDVIAAVEHDFQTIVSDQIKEALIEFAAVVPDAVGLPSSVVSPTGNQSCPSCNQKHSTTIRGFVYPLVDESERISIRVDQVDARGCAGKLIIGDESVASAALSLWKEYKYWKFEKEAHKELYRQVLETLKRNIHAH